MCDECADGYYGIATLGTPDACQPCSCPLPAPSGNNFSPTCVGGSNGILCTNCSEGHTGMNCETCIAGLS